jgi:hypothetical protein
MAKSVWPYDTWIDPIAPPRDSNKLTCFLLSPSQPKERWDDLYRLVRSVCQHVGEELQIKFECVRAVEITSAGVIHPEIWEQIKNADVVVADVSGQNGNVMLELGVASAWRRKEHVIILREANPDEPHPFDINPARHLEYHRTATGFQKLVNQLHKTIFQALSAAPFEAIPDTQATLPFTAPLSDGRDSIHLCTPDIAHRRLLSNCLEFGSLYVFPNSWLSFSNLKLRNVRVRAEMKFTLRRQPGGWVGIMLRSQLCFANSGHLIYLNSDGAVLRTVPENDLGKYHDEQVGQIDHFDPDSEEFVAFDVSIDEEALNVSVGPVQNSFAVRNMPYVFGRGNVLFQTYFARAGIRNIRIEQLN